ncbi:Uncharacterised protein [Niallia circulans]|nr:Uncharacterised protein [Niallia circulans]
MNIDGAAVFILVRSTEQVRVFTGNAGIEDCSVFKKVLL